MARREDDDLLGHNSVAADELRSFVERVEKLEDEKKNVQEDIKEVKSEARNRGYDLKALNAVLKLRKQDREEREQEAAMVELYLSALGMD